MTLGGGLITTKKKTLTGGRTRTRRSSNKKNGKKGKSNDPKICPAPKSHDAATKTEMPTKNQKIKTLDIAKLTPQRCKNKEHQGSNDQKTFQSRKTSDAPLTKPIHRNM